jgi:phosphosulfolactate synthase (CoM biosynthesis protein A)
MGLKNVVAENEGITVGGDWRTDVVTKIARELHMENMMFEAADPKVLNWDVRGKVFPSNILISRIWKRCEFIRGPQLGGL